ncbi:MAG: cytochrome c family protein [Anaerolineae bacterium]|jgi:hypothetical protein|nr:cytochrome c family protein [Anaerolineae bacterium]
MRRSLPLYPPTRPIIPLILLITLVLCAACAAPPQAGPVSEAETQKSERPAEKATITKDIATGVKTTAKAGAAQADSVSLVKKPPEGTSLQTFTTADFAGSGVCASCHLNLKDQSGADVSMPTMWRSTMMANAGRDPIWQAKVSSEVKRAPALREVIEKKCTTCHMPIAETQVVAEGGKVVALGNGFYNTAHPLHDAAVEGVSCTLCHQVQGANFGTMESFSGGYKVDTSTEPPDRVIFGPFENPVGEVMQASTGFKPEFGSHMETAEHCATCHNLYTPYIDAEGNVLGEFPEQTPYTEWQYSTFGKSNQSCQGCHMPQAQGGVRIAITPPDLPERQPFYQHFFVGGNAYMLRILREWGGTLGVTADTEHFDATLERVGVQVGERSATLGLSGLDLTGDTLTAKFEVDVLTGHKFPASFPSRRAWLHVTVTDAAGKVVFESGKHNADGSIEGNAADEDAAAYEPHYDVITAADQVQIYEPIMGDNEGAVTYQLLRAAQYLKDNRLLPQGSDKATLPKDIAVYGEAADDRNFAGGRDEVTYEIDVKDAVGPFTVSAELLYEPLSFRFMQDLLADDTPEVKKFAALQKDADASALVVAATEPATTR